jgi:hypothetical protein
MAAIGLVEVGRRLPRALARTGPWVLLGLVCAALLWRQDAALRESKMRFWLMHSPPWTAYLGQTDLRGTFLAGHQAAGEYVRRRAQPGDRLAVTEAGVVPFYAETATLDLLGLNDRQIAELWRSARSVDSPEGGRDVRRAYRQLVFAEPPRWFVLDGHFNRPSGGFTPRLRTARWIVQSPEWRRYRPVFRSRVYDAKTAGMQNDRINVVFERDDAPP